MIKNKKLENNLISVDITSTIDVLDESVLYHIWDMIGECTDDGLGEAICNGIKQSVQPRGQPQTKRTER